MCASLRGGWLVLEGKRGGGLRFEGARWEPTYAGDFGLCKLKGYRCVDNEKNTLIRPLFQVRANSDHTETGK